MFYPEGLVDFALEKFYIPKMGVCGNGYSQNIVKASLFMILIIALYHNWPLLLDCVINM